MKLPWSRGQKPSGAAEARKARERAERELERVRAETPTYEALGDSLRRLRQENHFATRIELIFQGGKQ